jgi:hypothetical protein
METLIWLQREGFQRVIVKLDCKWVVDNFNGRVFDVIEFENILQFCKAFLNVNQNYNIILSQDNLTLLLTPLLGCQCLLLVLKF